MSSIHPFILPVIAKDLEFVRNKIKEEITDYKRYSLNGAPARLVDSRQCSQLESLVKVLGANDLTTILNKEYELHRHVVVLQKSNCSLIVPCSWWCVNAPNIAAKVVDLIGKIKSINFWELYHQKSMVMDGPLVNELNSFEFNLESILIDEFENYRFIPALKDSNIYIRVVESGLSISILSTEMLVEDARGWLVETYETKLKSADLTLGFMIEIPFAPVFLDCDIENLIPNPDGIIKKIDVYGELVLIWFNTQIRTLIQEYKTADFPDPEFSQMARKFISIL